MRRPHFQPLSHRLRQHRHLLLLALLMSLNSALLSQFKITQSLDWLWFDSTQKFSQLPATDDIVIIEIDERSIQKLGRWPWPRDLHAELLQTLKQSKAVFFDVIFSDEDKQNPQADMAFAQALAQQESVLLPLYLEQLGHQGQLLEITPADIFYQAVDAIGHVHVSADPDGVVRSLYLREGVGSAYWPHISLALLNLLQPHQRDEAKVQTPPYNAHSIARQEQRWLPMPSPEQGLVHFSYVDVVEGAVKPAALKNKIVFIGATAPGLGDIFTTSIGNMAGVELNAWAFQALRHQQMITPAAAGVGMLANSLLVFFLTFWFGRMSPRNLLLATVTTVLSLLLITSSLQLILQQWLSLIPAIVCIIVFYPLWSWRRLEVALDYLRLELTRLRASSTSHHDIHQQQQKQRQFWNTLGLSSPQQARLALEQTPAPVSLKNLYGSELIEQTISQITREKELAKLNQQLIESSLAQLQDAVMITDAGGHILFTNQRWHELFPDEKNHDLLTQLNRIELAGQTQWTQIIADLYSGESLHSTQGILNHNTDLLCQLQLSSIAGQTLDTLIITLTNVSELKAAERSRLEALNFLSHDLRSPMVSVIAILELERKRIQRQNTASVQDIPDNLNDDNAFLNDIEILVRKNLRYADSFLQLSRAQSLTPAQLQLCDMHAVIDAAQMQGLALAKSKSIALITQRTDSDAWVMGDQDALERAIINLLSNAVKYSSDKTQITLSITTDDQSVWVCVADQGQGIAAEAIDTLFDRFTRGKQSHQEMGAGLGLHYVATVAKRHHGEIRVSSQQLQGSQFTLQLPLHIETEAE